MRKGQMRDYNKISKPKKTIVVSCENCGLRCKSGCPKGDVKHAKGK